MIIWLIGISGSGKSTLGNLLCSEISKTENKVRLIDGDIVRAFFNNDLGYSKKEREEWIILDTFDQYSPKYDQPQKIENVFTDE